MSPFTLLGRDWRANLAELISSSDRELLISSPYISSEGVRFVDSNLPSRMRNEGRLVLLTDLSPMSICQGSTDPSAIQSLTKLTPQFDLFHLPKLHAKVYVSDARQAIITSGNLTSGGLYVNFEYGMLVSNATAAALAQSDLLDYANLGGAVGARQLANYCAVAEKVRSAFRTQLSGIAKQARDEFQRSIIEAQDELIKIRLTKGSLHTVFAEAVIYLLKREGPLETPKIHLFIESIYPDLCDNTIDRVIDGKRFGKKWKHAVRSAQQHLKKRGLIDEQDGKWQVTDPQPEVRD